MKPPDIHVLGDTQFNDALEACLGNYYQHRIIVEWLLYCIAKPENDNILQRALFIQLTSIEMIAQLRVGAIMFMAVIVPMRWLAANTHVLGHHQWGERNMAEAINLIYQAFMQVGANGALILDKIS